MCNTHESSFLTQ